MARHNEIGHWGETVARDFLLGSGYAIRGMNVKVGGYELDIIAERDGRIIFVEVKTRGADGTDPLEAVDGRRRRRMARAADLYIRSTGTVLEPQFDIVTVVGSPEDGHVVEHFVDAFLPPLMSY